VIDTRLIIIGIFLALSIFPIKALFPFKSQVISSIRKKKNRSKKKPKYMTENDQEVLSYVQKQGVHIILKEPANEDKIYKDS
jgi:hypothetical protein